MADDSPDFKSRIARWVRHTRQKVERRFRTWASADRGERFGLTTAEALKRFDAKKAESVLARAPIALAALGIVLAALVTAQLVGLWIRSAPVPMPMRPGAAGRSQQAPYAIDTESILKRNMFNVEGKIPDPFDQGMLDCMSQARPSTQRIQLMGTIVMTDEAYSVALIQEEGSNVRIGVRKDDTFSDGKYTAMKVERKRFCFQVRASQDFEYVEIPDEGGGLKAPQLGLANPVDGIAPVSEGEFHVKKAYLDQSLGRLNDILQTARAVPYIERDSGRFRGFLVQSVEPDSPFAALGIRQGDVIIEANGVPLDNPGRGLEAFQKFRNATKVSIRILRNGSEKSLSYEVRS